MCKNNDVVSEKAENARIRRTDAEVRLLEMLSGEALWLFNEYLDANVEYEDCLM